MSKAGSVPKLRFPEFKNSDAWGENPLAKLVSTVTPPKKLQTTDYAESGKFPIIDQSQDFICGWTNDDDAIIHDALPLIIFGDHTCALKFVDRPFAQGADGIKILSAEKTVEVSFLFQSLQATPLEMKGYRRHFSILKEKRIAFPDIDTGEQQKIADCLTSIDDLIKAEAEKLTALKDHKKGLMQQLFPREGETKPRLRFPEFRNAGDWEGKPLNKICKMNAGEFVPASKISELPKENLFHCYGGNGLRGFTESYTHEGTFSLIGRQGALCGNITLATGKFHATEHAIVTVPSENTVTNWLYYQLVHLNLNQHATGQAQPGLSVKNLNEIPVLIPQERSEQQAISDCLTSIDDLITSEAEKLSALKDHKKGLMQQLFPASDEVNG